MENNHKSKAELEGFEDCRLLFRNFSGEERRFNEKGKRNFCVALTTEEADRLTANGWNVKYLKARDEEEEPLPYLKVKLKYKQGSRPPRVVLINSKGKRNLTEKSVDILDWADIETVDLIVSAYNWDVSGKTGKTAYMRSIYVTIREDAFESKYFDKDDLDGEEEYE